MEVLEHLESEFMVCVLQHTLLYDFNSLYMYVPWKIGNGGSSFIFFKPLMCHVRS